MDLLLVEDASFSTNHHPKVTNEGIRDEREEKSVDLSRYMLSLKPNGKQEVSHETEKLFWDFPCLPGQGTWQARNLFKRYPRMQLLFN